MARISKIQKFNIKEYKPMKEDPFDKETDAEIKELIRVKIDIYGLTQEDIDFLRGRASEILNDKK